MITVVRLKPRNKKAGHGMLTYTSAAGNKYTVGVGIQPSPIKIIDDESEIQELSEYSQFEILTFKDRKTLDESIETELAQKVRQGYTVVKPIIEDVRKGKRTAASILESDDESVSAKDNDDDKPVNTGRKPSPAIDPQRAQLVAKIIELENTHAKSIELGRTEATIEKWESKLSAARLALKEYDGAITR